MVPLTRLSVAPIGWLEAVLTTAIVPPLRYKSFSEPLALLLILATDLARADATLIRRKASLMSRFNSLLQHN